MSVMKKAKYISSIQVASHAEELAPGYLINSSREGILFADFVKLIVNIPIQITEWAKMLNLSERTFLRYKKEKKAFDSIYTDRILQVVTLYKRGAHVFGDAAKFNQWMELPNLALENKNPKSFIDSSFGIQLVHDELSRIEHGIFA